MKNERYIVSKMFLSFQISQWNEMVTYWFNIEFIMIQIQVSKQQSKKLGFSTMENWERYNSKNERNIIMQVSVRINS